MMADDDSDGRTVRATPSIAEERKGEAMISAIEIRRERFEEFNKYNVVASDATTGTVFLGSCRLPSEAGKLASREAKKFGSVWGVRTRDGVFHECDDSNGKGWLRAAAILHKDLCAEYGLATCLK
jgi:hypothetical protein